MSEDRIVEVEGMNGDNATLLLAAVEEMDYEGGASVVRTTSYDRFLVPESVAKKAGVDYRTEDERAEAEAEAAEEWQAKIKAAQEDVRPTGTSQDSEEPARRPARKAAAKKTAAKNEE